MPIAKEPQYIKVDGLTDEVCHKLEAAKLGPPGLSRGAKAEVQSTASSEEEGSDADHDADAEQVDTDGRRAVAGGNQDLYDYNMMGAWGAVAAAEAAAATLYGGYGCWPPYPFMMPPPIPMDMSSMYSQDPRAFDGWAAHGGMTGGLPHYKAAESDSRRLPKNAPPPKSPMLKGALLEGEGDVPAPPPGIAGVDPKQLQKLEPPPGLSLTAPSRAPPLSAAAVKTSAPVPTAAASEIVDSAQAVAEAVATDCLLEDEEDVAPPAPPGLSLPQPPSLTRARSLPQDNADVPSAPPPPFLARAVSLPAGVASQPAESAVKVDTTEEGGYTVRWNVDARKLKVKDKVVVSPSFKLSTDRKGALGSTFRVVMYPTAVSDRKGGASFRKAKGKGSVHLKCESNLDGEDGSLLEVYFQVQSPKEDDTEQESRRGPVIHNFFESGFCSLPKSESEWDFQRATEVSPSSEIFVVLLEISAKEATS